MENDGAERDGTERESEGVEMVGLERESDGMETVGVERDGTERESDGVETVGVERYGVDMVGSCLLGLAGSPSSGAESRGARRPRPQVSLHCH